MLYVHVRMTNSLPETISVTQISCEWGMMGSLCWPFLVSLSHVYAPMACFYIAVLYENLSVCPFSGLLVQLDWVLSVLLPDQHYRGTLWSNLRLRPLSHQVDSHCEGMYCYMR